MSAQFNNNDTRIIKDMLGLLVNLGASPTDAYNQVSSILKPLGWDFAYFNDIEDFWIIDNELK